MGANFVTATILIAALWSVLCRINLMKHGVTKPSVFIQHATLAMGLACGLFLPPPYAKMALAFSVLVFLLFGAGRWKFGAPEGIHKPTHLRTSDLAKVSGGKQ